MSAGRLGELGAFILRGEAIKLYRSFLRLARQAPEGSQAELRAEVRREFEAARAASQRRKHEQQQRQSQPPQQQGGEGGGTAGSSSDADPRGARRRAPLPPPLAPASDDDAYATKKALSDGREALKRLRDMIELRR